jgi:hypothetical protein
MPVPNSQAPEEVISGTLQMLQKLAEGKRTVWGVPIPWVAEPVFASGFQVAPDYGAANQVILATYQLPRGYRAVLCGLVLGYVGGGGAALPGQVLYTVDVNNDSAAVVSPQSGYTEKDYNQVPFQLGTLSPAEPWPVEFRHDQGETVRVKGYTVSGVATGAGNFLYAALVGFQWPSMGWEQ